MNIYKKLALFAGGTLFGSAGIKLLSSKDAKNAWVKRCPYKMPLSLISCTTTM